MSLQRVAILISGGGSNMLRLIEAMQEKCFATPVLVLSNDPSAGGLTKAAALGVPVAHIDHRPFGGDRAGFEAALLAHLRAAAVDVICLAGFMRILTPAFINTYAGRILNIHPSLLPKYPGLHTHKRAIEAGDSVAGCTVHEVIADLDAGPIRAQAQVPIIANDTPDSLAARVLVAEHQLYPQALADFIRDLQARLGGSE